MVIEDTVFVQTVEAGWIPEPLPSPPPIYTKPQPPDLPTNTSPEPEERTIEEWAQRFFSWVNKIIGLETEKTKTS
ncbi:hypothetical protein TWF788_001737 [Orbilia oligospora]|uniref:Uncharacterized protein n=1 Tax=Orbilia oligospora TaxID=2813651 RepID=A0A7C8PDP1_ORBOL|nr:hypothetical protein TWF788_001737 [Orbilia oligospora]